MNRLGMLIDLAHGTLEDVKAAVDVSTKPMIVSHTMQNSSAWSRFVSPEHARLVTARGGLIGSIPASLLARGVSADDVAKILGGNFRRVFREVTGA